MNIYVGNLDFRINEDDLKELFKDFGTVDSVQIIVDKYTGKSRGFGFVSMNNSAEASKAIEKLNGTSHENRELVVNEAKPRKEKF